MKTVDIILTAFFAAIVGSLILFAIAYTNNPLADLKDTDRVKGSVIVGNHAYEVIISGKYYKACPTLVNVSIVK